MGTLGYSTMNSPVSSTTASTMLIAGPAKAMIIRCQRGLARRTADRCAMPLIAGLFARHLDVSAEQNRREAEIGLAVLEAEQARTKSEAERLDLDVEEASRPIVAQFVDQDHHPDQNQIPPDVL